MRSKRGAKKGIKIRSTTLEICSELNSPVPVQIRQRAPLVEGQDPMNSPTPRPLACVQNPAGQPSYGEGECPRALLQNYGWDEVGASPAVSAELLSN